MERIIVDAELLQKLSQLARPLELCDAAGHVLARVQPVLDPSVWEAVTPEVSEEELDRREKANEKRYTTAEVVARLEGH
jgi:hypothetical protein